MTANGIKRLKCMEFMFISYSGVDGSNKWLGRLFGEDATILVSNRLVKNGRGCVQNDVSRPFVMSNKQLARSVGITVGARLCDRFVLFQ